MISSFGPKADELAVLHDADQIDGRERARAMSDHDGDAAAARDAFDRLRQRRLALRVEVGVRLVEDDQEGIAVERPGKADALALAGGEGRAMRTELGLVAIWQAARSSRGRPAARAAPTISRALGIADRSAQMFSAIVPSSSDTSCGR